MKINYNNKEYDLPVMTFALDEMETSVVYQMNGEVLVYTSIRKDINKIMSITDDSNIEPLTVNRFGNINSIKAKLSNKNIGFRKAIEKWYRVY